MVVVGDIYANSPIFAGLIGRPVAYVVGSHLSKATLSRSPTQIQPALPSRCGSNADNVAARDSISSTATAIPQHVPTNEPYVEAI
jgi:hypothetical protein